MLKYFFIHFLQKIYQKQQLREKCLNSECFWLIFSCICTEYEYLLCKSPVFSSNATKIRTGKNSKQEHVLRSESFTIALENRYPEKNYRLVCLPYNQTLEGLMSPRKSSLNPQNALLSTKTLEDLMAGSYGMCTT